MVYKDIPLVPLREIVLFPDVITSFFIGRERSIFAIDRAMLNDKLIAFVAQKKEDIDEPSLDDLYLVGVLSEILQVLKLPDGRVKILVEGISRFKIKAIKEENCFLADGEELRESYKKNEKIEALSRYILDNLKKYINLREGQEDIFSSLLKLDSPIKLGNMATYNLSINLREKQRILEITSLEERLKEIGNLILKEVEIQTIERELEDKIKQEMEKKEKEYYLSEKIRVLQNELYSKKGKDVEQFFSSIKKLPEDVKERVYYEYERFRNMPSYMAEREVLRNWLDWVVSLPWNEKTEEKQDIKSAKALLDNGHFGLSSVKQRVLEFLAIRKMTNRTSGSILCFIGPTGVGKTSIANSIADVLNRKFAQMSLSGLRDEAEIKGHRMTYVAAMPGKIIQLIRRTKSKNPVFLLDEIDKVDFRTNYGTSLLDVLSGENKNFLDYYIDIPFDLSEVIFITTGNTIENIPSFLLDRMEVIEFPSYTLDEKFHIAKRYLIPREIEAHGLSSFLSFSDRSIKTMTTSYTREGGVRNLKKCIEMVCRKSAFDVVCKNRKIKISSSNLRRFIGKPIHRETMISSNGIGCTYSLAWTEQGGEILTTEALCIPGEGRLFFTGKLGMVMKEQGEAVLSYIRSRTKEFDLSPSFYKDYDIHIHLPWGAIEKDGPSAGVAIGCSVISSLTNKPLKGIFAMTGEVTLSGKILPVFGIREKLLAALRVGIKKVFIPKENYIDLDELPKRIKKELEIILVEDMDEVLSYVF
ncbi:TPA: endopeptidase La [bacterium]|nr:endopeptidase La [bacterium]